MVHRTPRRSDRLREEDFTISSAPGHEPARSGPTRVRHAEARSGEANSRPKVTMIPPSMWLAEAEASFSEAKARLLPLRHSAPESRSGARSWAGPTGEVTRPVGELKDGGDSGNYDKILAPHQWGHPGFPPGIQDFPLAALVDATSRVSDNYRVKRFSENTPMTMPERLNDTVREKSDGDAVRRHAFHGEPLDPEVARRVRERGAEITEEIYREHGEIDPETIHALIRDDDET
jgi:hypothetical protein